MPTPFRPALALALAACLAAALASASPAGAVQGLGPLPGAIVDDMAPPLGGWSRSGTTELGRVALRDGSGLRLSGSGSIRRRLPSRPWSLSLDLRLGEDAALVLEVGPDRLILTRGDTDELLVRGAGVSADLPPVEGWASGGWRHLEVVGGTSTTLSIDGKELENGIRPGAAISLRAARGDVRLTGMVATRRDDRRALLLHRLAELHARTPPGRFPVGVGDDDGVLRFTRDWTDGFWPGMLWRAYDLTRAPLFREWALYATIRHLGREDERVHDQGFRYLESSAAAHDRVCGGRSPPKNRCEQLRKSALAAADVLVAMAAENPGTETIPTVGAESSCRACAPGEVETVVDSMMNLGLLQWASAEAKLPAYGRTAVSHALAVQRLLVRGDGSTRQGVRTVRADGAVVAYDKRQGLSAESTWARGQAWAVYGFAQTGAAYRRPDLVAQAERLAVYVSENLPANPVPRYDYDAPAGAPADTSAGVITAAGLFRLAAACKRFTDTCRSGAPRWERLAARMLDAALRGVKRQPPLGMLTSQVYSLGGSATWDDSGEYAFGLDYALEAIRRRLAG